MKTFFMSALLFFFVLSGAFSNPLIFKVKAVQGEAAVVVQLANLGKNRTQLFLKTLDGQTRYLDYLWKQDGYSVRLSLEGMEDGTYLIGVANKEGRSMRVLSLSGGQARLFTEGEGQPQGAKISIGKDGQKMKTTLANDGKGFRVQLVHLDGEMADVRIMSLSSVNWYREVSKAEGGFNKAFITEGMPDGQYYLYLQNGNMEVVQFFEISNGAVKLQERQSLLSCTGSNI